MDFKNTSTQHQNKIGTDIVSDSTTLLTLKARSRTFI